MKFLKDILRDKGSTKYSITKTLALSTFVFLLIYLGYYLLWLKVAIDHTLLLELLGFTGGLVGLKNNWGTRSKVQEPKNDKVILESATDNSNDEEEGVF